MAWRHEHIETIKQILKQKFKEALTKDMSIDECTTTIRRILQEERKALYEKTNYSVYFKSFTTYDSVPSVRINLINEYNKSEKLLTIDLLEEPSKLTEPTKEQTKASQLPDVCAIAKFLQDNLVGCFKFDIIDKEELASIRAKIASLFSTLDSDIATYVVENVYYELVSTYYLMVEFSRNYAGKHIEPFKIAIDYQTTDIVNPDNLENTIKREPDFDPYCEESIRNLTIEQFIALTNTIKRIKESLK